MDSRQQISCLQETMVQSIIGQDAVVERLMIGLLANGNLLIEGLPGLAKTRAVKSMAKGLAADFSRIQFTPDLLPADITGTEVLHTAGGEHQFRFEAGPIFAYIDWRFFKRHTVSYRHFDLQRSATSTSSVSIAIGGEIFDISLPIQSYFDIDANEISYAYSLMFDRKKELFVGLGISVQDLEFGIQGTESSPDPGEIINSTLNSTAPLPTLNVGFNYAFSDNWLFYSRAGWLAVELDLGADEELSGQIINADAGITWRAFDRVSFFAQYQIFDVNVDFADEDKIFELDYDYKGPMLGVSVNF